MSILIKSATVVTQNSNREILEGDILINGNKIEAIGKNLNIQDAKPETVLDASGKIAIPGLINAHTHVAMTALRGLGEDLPLQRWLKEKIWPAEKKLTAKDVYHGALLGIAELIRSGVTTFNDMYFIFPDEVAKATEKTGLRATLSHVMLDLPFKTSPEKESKKAQSFIGRWRDKPLLTPSVSCHGIYTCSEELLIAAKELANREKLKFHIHVSETRKEIFDCLEKTKKYPLEYLDSLGLLDENTILAHASWVTKREIAIIGKKKATIVNCPISNLKLATGGICPVCEYYAQGANVCIGTDGAASNNSLNMFESIKLSSLLQKHHYWKADAVPTQAFLDFATINGAKALGINAGSIERGKLADIVLLDTKMPNMQPLHNVISNLVYAAGPQNVTDVMVNGKMLMQNRKILTVEEEEIAKHFS
ncbi:MAG TPA: amidohydrolase [Candidatus Bilamarchaeaceae archaeon]|nr:amidohydrolase [Candidatus Bilamarchaeaceae archaeon]